MVFIVFALGMGYLVYRSTRTDFDLVETDYYGTELRYQQEIDASKKAHALSEPVSMAQGPQGVTIQFPKDMRNKKLAGTILFYCAYDRKADRTFPVQADSEGIQLIPAKLLPSGNFFVKINWTEENNKYYMEQELSVL
jgi:hypothetical protein